MFFAGYQACILGNTTIGDNVIIGARAVVKGNIPSNTVWAGVPAKQICTLEELYERRTALKTESAFKQYEFMKHKNSAVEIKSMKWFAALFLERTEENYNKYLSDLKINGVADSKKAREFFFKSVPIFNGFDEFINAYNCRKETNNAE